MAKPPKKPIARAISLELCGPGLPTFHLSVHYEGDPATPDQFTGHAELGGHRIARVYGTIEGLSFKPKNPPGRRKERARDMAVWLAYNWLRHKNFGSNEAKAEIQKQWAYHGITDPSHVSAKIRNVERELPTGVELTLLMTSSGEGPHAFVVVSESIQTIGSKMSFSGPGWIWSAWEMKARYVRFTR